MNRKEKIGKVLRNYNIFVKSLTRLDHNSREVIEVVKETTQVIFSLKSILNKDGYTSHL